MPKKFPVEVHWYAIQKKREGYSWDEVAEMVKREFALDPPPSRRQMTKWLTTGTQPEVMAEQIKQAMRSPEKMSKFLESVPLVQLITEELTGKDFGVLTAKYYLSQLEALVDFQALKKAWAEFAEEKERSQESSNGAESVTT